MLLTKLILKLISKELNNKLADSVDQIINDIPCLDQLKHVALIISQIRVFETITKKRLNSIIQI